MLHWQTEPDQLLMKIVDEAIADALDFSHALKSTFPPDWAECFPSAARFFSIDSWMSEAQKLKAANRSPQVFQITDYHWLLLEEVLRRYCELYNDGTIDRIVHEGTRIREIDFEGILELFFWDLDFAIPFEELAALGLSGREQMGTSDEALAIAAGLAPHADELVLEEVESPRWLRRDGEEDDEEEVALFRPGCPVYPAGSE
jgi:hypothetical protein